MITTGWARYPSIDANFIFPDYNLNTAQLLDSSLSAIPRGMGRSYGDSALSANILSSERLDHLLAFEPETGILTCEAGVTLAEILSFAVPHGWFLPVTPGTKFVSVGGAIASDVHGKNHHVDGCFSDHVQSLVLRTATNETVICSASQNIELFRATCGGMGLTGLVVEATIKLRPIETAFINETILKAGNLDEVFELFEEYSSASYSVAWIDCLSGGTKLGRSLLMLGEHTRLDELGRKSSDPLREKGGVTLPVPFNMPTFTLNQYSIRAFNTLYYHRVRKKVSEHCVHYEPFFYPLDGLSHWYRLYGKRGFVQYQCVFPMAESKRGMTKLLECISNAQKGSFLAVLKAFGPGNENYLSFPFEGYTLALDFKIEPDLAILLQKLDEIVLEHGGRLYLSKDSRMKQEMFQAGYPQLDAFRQVRRLWKADKLFHSLQSRRLGL